MSNPNWFPCRVSLFCVQPNASEKIKRYHTIWQYTKYLLVIVAFFPLQSYFVSFFLSLSLSKSLFFSVDIRFLVILPEEWERKKEKDSLIHIHAISKYKLCQTFSTFRLITFTQLFSEKGLANCILYTFFFCRTNDKHNWPQMFTNLIVFLLKNGNWGFEQKQIENILSQKRDIVASIEITLMHVVRQYFASIIFCYWVYRIELPLLRWWTKSPLYISYTKKFAECRLHFIWFNCAHFISWKKLLHSHIIVLLTKWTT